jgi:hypothetical protein
MNLALVYRGGQRSVVTFFEQLSEKMGVTERLFQDDGVDGG